MQIIEKRDDRVVVEVNGERLELLRASHDERRTIYELDTPQGTLQFFRIHADKLPLGKHFHRKKSETFTIISGGGYALHCDVEEDGTKAGEVWDVQLYPDVIVGVAPYNAHTFYLRPGSEMTCVSSQPFDQEDLCPASWLVDDAA